MTLQQQGAAPAHNPLADPLAGGAAVLVLLMQALAWALQERCTC